MSIYANKFQCFFTYTGYYCNTFAREAFRNIEKCLRPLPKESLCWRTNATKIIYAVRALLTIPFAAVLVLPSLTCYGLAGLAGRGRLEKIESKIPPKALLEQFIKVLSLNVCFQDPYSPLTGGVVTPFESVDGSTTRIKALIEAVANENPTVFLGQEFDNLAAQDESIRLLKLRGFSYFLRDLGSTEPIRNHSGLFVASKIPLENIDFIPYSIKDRAGLAKMSAQGALTFTVRVQDKNLRLINVHLNYGDGEENEKARSRQLKNHIEPLLKQGDGRAVLFGDLNRDTSNHPLGLTGLINALEGHVTCSNQGKHTLLGKKKPCTDCPEKIDGLIYDPEKIKASFQMKPLSLHGIPLTDHYAIIAKVQIAQLTEGLVVRSFPG